MKAIRRRGLRFIRVANKASAGFMAEVCFRLTRRHNASNSNAAALLKYLNHARCFQPQAKP